MPSIKDMLKYNRLATVRVVGQRALPANMLIWEQSLSVQCTESAFVTQVLDKNCILREHFAALPFVSLFQPLT